MQMTPDEIITDYRQAKDPEMQRRILSDLNCCDVREIDNILSRNGITVKPIKYNQLPQKKPPKINHALTSALYNAGKNDKEIAEACCVAKETARVWRISNRLLPNAGPGGRRPTP